jgi:hypothetical protein
MSEKENIRKWLKEFAQRLKQNVKVDNIIVGSVSDYETIFLEINNYSVILRPHLDENGKLLWTSIDIREMENDSELLRLGCGIYEYILNWNEDEWERWIYERSVDETTLNLPGIQKDEQKLFEVLTV